MGLEVTNYCFTTPCYGLRLLLHGFNNKLPLLLQDVLGQLSELSITEDIFAMAKEKAETEYRNRVYQQANYYNRSLLTL
jgi:secreted Zn-dependent insulinase-like peptidase